MENVEFIKEKVRAYSSTLKTTVSRSTIHWLDSLTGGAFSASRFRQKYFAEIPVDLARIPSFRREFFPDSGPSPWIDRKDALQQIAARLKSNEISEQEAQYLTDIYHRGYFVARGLFSSDLMDCMWAVYENAVKSGKIVVADEKISENDFLPGRFLNPHRYLPELRKLHAHPKLMRLASLVMGKPAIAYQTINSFKGSQQKSHSDTIHMTTYPLGYLTAAWIAFEDIHEDSGPLFYYPGSHRLPYLLSREAGIPLGSFESRGYEPYGAKYEPAIQAAVDKAGFTREHFIAKKGDVLFWHANLVHGGSLRKNPKLSRKAMVCHYFAKGAVCYHDLSEGLASMKIASRTYAH